MQRAFRKPRPTSDKTVTEVTFPTAQNALIKTKLKRCIHINISKDAVVQKVRPWGDF